MGISCQINSSCVFLCCSLLSVHLATNDPRNGISFLAALRKLKNCGQHTAGIFSDPFCILAILSPDVSSTSLPNTSELCPLCIEIKCFEHIRMLSLHTCTPAQTLCCALRFKLTVSVTVSLLIGIEL